MGDGARPFDKLGDGFRLGRRNDDGSAGPGGMGSGSGAGRTRDQPGRGDGFRLVGWKDEGSGRRLVLHSAFLDIVESRDLGGGRYAVTIAANERVRRPPDLDLAGMSTEAYMRNPVVMWAHDVVGRSPSGGLPVGRTLELSKGAGGRLVAEFEFLAEDPFAHRVKNAWDKGFLRAASVSWVPVESESDESGRRRDVTSELVEWSLVPVPADPDALRESYRRLMADALDGDEVA